MYLDEALDKKNTGYRRLEANSKYNSATRYYFLNSTLGIYEVASDVTEENFESKKDSLCIYQRKW
jgi:hypothetical protein